MTRAEFLNDIYHHLYGMTQEQAEQHLTYYAEMLADRMEEGMSEEEAVAGMEDVETIARRIMEEEGLPYTPPEYPNVSKFGGGGGGMRVYQVPKRKNWRKLLQIAIWSAAVIAVFSGLHRWAARRIIDETSVKEDVGWEIQEPYDYSYGYDECSYVDAPYNGGYEYAGFDLEFPADTYQSLDIEWASGMVYIQSYTGNSIRVQEYGQSPLSERTQLDCQEEGGSLVIRYRAGAGLGTVKGGKWLTVLVPDGILEKLKIATTSAAVWLNELELAELSVSTASGDITPTECYTQKAQLNTVSADLYLSGLYAEELEISTTSGDVGGDLCGRTASIHTISGDISLYNMDDIGWIELYTTSGSILTYVENLSTQRISAASVSGDITMSLPYDLGFTLDYSTVSGDLDLTSAFDLNMQSGKYVCNGGGCEIAVETVSGNLEIY